MFLISVYFHMVGDSSCFVFYCPRVTLVNNYFRKPRTALGQWLWEKGITLSVDLLLKILEFHKFL